MFNQKLTGTIVDDWSSISAPYVRPEQIHNCGNTILKYSNKGNSSTTLPLQTWTSPYVASEMYAMRKITNPTEYFNNIKDYLTKVVLNDSIPLKMSGMSQLKYRYVGDYSKEPLNSLLNAIELELTNKIQNVLAQATDSIDMFKDYNPICEGLVLTDITINTYQATDGSYRFYHQCFFSAVNTTRYNTIMFKGNFYQDATPISNYWNAQIAKVQNSEKPDSTTANVNTVIYCSLIDLLNNTTCVTGQESECDFKGYMNRDPLEQSSNLDWLKNPGMNSMDIGTQGEYSVTGTKIYDNGPSNLDELIKRFS